MIFFYLIGFVVLCITSFCIVEIALDHKKELAKIERSDYICQKCKGRTPVVIHVDKK